MIRSATRSDRPAILRVAEASGLFEPDQLGELDAMLSSHFDNDSPAESWRVDDAASGIRGIAYAAPERMTEGTWNLLLIAVHPDEQRSGRGTNLVADTVAWLRERGHRLLVVETLGLPEFDGARAFYRNRGFSEEATIRDFYHAGGDKIVFTLRLDG